MRQLLPPALLLLLGVFSTPGIETGLAQTGASPSIPPHVILVSVDTLRADRLSCYGYSENRTPAIDRLAREGVLFEYAITPAPITLPAHASLFTGTYPVFHGVRDNSGFVLPEDAETLAEVLREAGYRTGAFVGAFVLDSRFGLDQGFDHYFDDFETETLELVTQRINERRAEEVLDRARQWIRSQGTARPLFVFIHLFDPHAPYDAPEAFSRRVADPYDAEVAYVDDQLGRFFDFLGRSGLYDNSLIIFTSDHGEGLGDHGEDTHGLFLYDSTLRVPLILRLPGGEPAGLRVGGQVRLIDVMPTVLQVLRLPGCGDCQGRGLVSYWRSGQTPDLPALSETMLPLLNYGWSDLASYRVRGTKYIRAPRPELYDLAADPREKTNLYDGERALAAGLGQELQRDLDRFSSGAASTAQRRIDAETLERLRSLGYITLAPPQRASTLHSDVDPKDKIHLFNAILAAHAASAAGREAESTRILNDVLREDDRIFAAHSLQALNHLRASRPDRALANLESTVRLRPDDFGARFYLGIALIQLGRLAEAAGELEAALQLDPDSEAALNNLGTVYTRLRDYPRAARIFEGLTERKPRDAAAWVNLGVVRMMEGESDRALEAFDRALGIDPGLPEVHNNIGLILMNAGRAREAVPRFERALVLRPDYEIARRNLERARALAAAE
jgi:choline-sulfatase